MRSKPIVLAGCVAATLCLGTPSGRAEYAAQYYPFCKISSSSGATSCYFRSRAECGASCISNPWYVGNARVPDYLRAYFPRRGR